MEDIGVAGRTVLKNIIHKWNKWLCTGMYLADEMGQTIVKVRVWWKTLTERESLKDLRVDGRKILKKIIHEWNRKIWTGKYLADDTDQTIK